MWISDPTAWVHERLRPQFGKVPLMTVGCQYAFAFKPGFAELLKLIATGISGFVFAALLNSQPKLFAKNSPLAFTVEYAIASSTARPSAELIPGSRPKSISAGTCSIETIFEGSPGWMTPNAL